MWDGHSCPSPLTLLLKLPVEGRTPSSAAFDFVREVRTRLCNWAPPPSQRSARCRLGSSQFVNYHEEWHWPPRGIRVY